jgi:hypothetical protein
MPPYGHAAECQSHAPIDQPTMIGALGHGEDDEEQADGGEHCARKV